MDFLCSSSSIDSSFYYSQAMNIIGVVSALAAAALLQVSLYLLQVPLIHQSPWQPGHLLNCLFNVQ